MPRRAFPLRLVHSLSPRTGVWQGRRREGALQAEAQYRFGGHSFADTSVCTDAQADEAARLSALLAQRAFQLVLKRTENTEPVRGLINQMGIDSSLKYPNGRYRVPKSPSICLGSTDLTNMEMTGAYTTFANNGIFNKPIYLLRIEDKNGRILYEEFPQEKVAINANANYVMVEMLKYAATGLGGLKSEVGGKTGTTNDYVDGWFMGITPTLVVGTWVGGEDRWIRFRSLAYGQGAYMAKPFFKEFLSRLEKSEDLGYDASARFHRPPGDIGIEMNCDQYQRSPLPLDNGEFENEGFGEDMFGDEIGRSAPEEEFQ